MNILFQSSFIFKDTKEKFISCSLVFQVQFKKKYAYCTVRLCLLVTSNLTKLQIMASKFSKINNDNNTVTGKKNE